MKKHCMCGLLWNFFVWMIGAHLVVAQESFHVYAASRLTQELLAIRAELSDGVFEFEMEERVSLGFAGATI